MKKGWPTKTLGEVCEVFADGDWVESKDQSSEGIRLIQTGNVGEGVFKDRAEKARYISEATFKRLRCTEIVEGDCLVSRLPDPVGRSCILPDTGERMITAVDCTILRFKSKQLLPTFFNLYSQSDDYLTTVAKECTGTTRNRISRSNLGLTPIPVPPLPEQQRIVRLLDEAFECLATAKANAEKNLQNARALFESHLQAVFTQRGEGWVETTLGDVIEIVGGSQPPKSVFSKTKKPDNIRLIQIRDYKSDNYVVFIPRDQAKRFCNANDVMIGRYGPPLFQILRGIEGAYNVALMKAVPDEAKLSHDFLFYFLKHSAILQYVIYHSSRAAGQIGVTKETLEPYPIALPSLAVQKMVVGNIQELENETQHLAQIYDRKLAALAELKKSLLHQAFNGEL